MTVGEFQSMPMQNWRIPLSGPILHIFGSVPTQFWFSAQAG
jgi:hypothetical protein